MRLEVDKYSADESRSNPMAVAMINSICPVNQVCFYTVIGPGTMGDKCVHFREEVYGADCDIERDFKG